MKKNNILFLFFLFIGINNLFAQINVSTGLNSTGGVGIQGSIDPNWQIASSPNPPGTPALVSSRHPLWQATPIAITNASWISQSGMFDNSPTGYYVFERAFTVGVASSLDCNFRIAYDDYLIGIELVAPNGTVVSLPVVINGYHLSNAITTSIPNPMTGVWKIRATVHFYDSVAAFMLSGSVNLPQPQTSLCLAPMEDALIHEFTPTTNYGASTTIRASRHTYGAGGGSGYYSTKGLYKFDLSGIPTNAVITSAILTLKTCPACTANGLDKHYDLSGLGNGATLKQVTSTWLENTVTWNTAPATAAAAVNIPSFGNNSTAPLIASVNSLMPASGGGNVSFMLSLADNSDYYHGVIFASKENIEVSIRPQLCITYTVPPCVNGLNAAHTTMPINTGVDDSGSMLPIGGTDTHWTASSGGFTVDNFYTGVWSGYPTNSQFIASNAGSTDYTFRRNFCIDPCSATQVNFNFKLFADNTACVYLDGITPLPLTWTSTSAAVTSCTQVIGIPQTPFLPTGGYTCNYTTTVPAGTHFLEVRVQNQSSSIAGLNVSGNISLVATPALALAATANCTGRSLSIAYANTNSNTLTWSVNGVLTSPTNAGSPATLPMPMSSCDTVFTVILTQTTPNTGCIKYDTVTVHANCCAPKFLVNTCNRNIVVTGMSNGNTSAPFSWTLIPCNNPTAQSYSGSTTMGQLFCTTQIDTGCYMLCLTLPNCPSACSGVCKQIRILPIPTLNLTTPNSAVCNGSNTSLTATTNVSLGSSFAWSSGGRTATITVAPAITTTYICTVTNSTGCTATASYIISVSACCISSIIKNSSFETGSTGGIGGSNLGYDGNTNNWSVAQGSPQLSPIGNLDSWSMQMWGVCEVTNAGGTGEAVKQTTVPFIAGHTYSISFTAQKMPMANTYNPIIVLRTTNTPLGMAGATVIASGTATSGSWQTFTATWTAPSGPSLDQLIISVHNASTINTGSLVSWARVDHVCIVDNGLSMNYCASLNGDFEVGSTIGFSTNFGHGTRTNNWQMAGGSSIRPELTTPGNGDMYAVKLSGMLPANYPLSEGSGIQQTFAIQAGHTYCISYKAKTDINNQYVCVRGTPVIQFRASNGALLTHTGGMPMGVAQNITSGTWATYNQSFTAPANFNTVSITAHSLNSIGYRSAYIDNICIKECNPCSPISIKNLASKLDGITFIAENSSHTSMSYNYKVVDDMGTEFAIGQIANLHPNEAATIEVAGLLPSKDYVLHAWPICDYAASNPTAFSTLNPDITISDNTTDTACLNATETDAFGTTTSDIKDANGRIIATVIPDAFTDLGTINVEVHNQNRPIVIDNQSFLGRTFNVTSNEIAGLIPNGGGYTMRLYFLDSELFTENGAAITPQNLGIKWWSGGSQTECLINDYINTPSSAGSFPVAGNIPSNQVNEGEFGRHNNGFYLQFHANHFTMFGASPDYTGLLPVKWLSFTGRVSSAKCAEKGSILLNWATASEQNVRDFTVERQAQKETSYKKIATQPAKNDENGAAYSFTDENLRSGTYNYRIKETDIDGTNDYTQIVSVLVNTCNHTAVYPNPTTAILELKTDGDRETPVTVFDINGRIIKEYTSIPESIDLATYPAGVYSLRIGEQVIKIVKL